MSEETARQSDNAQRDGDDLFLQEIRREFETYIDETPEYIAYLEKRCVLEHNKAVVAMVEIQRQAPVIFAVRRMYEKVGEYAMTLAEAQGVPNAATARVMRAMRDYLNESKRSPLSNTEDI